MCVEKLAGIESIISGILWIMISESVLLVQGGMTSLETHLESESFQDMSQDSIFGSKEEHGLRKYVRSHTGRYCSFNPWLTNFG